MTVKKAVIAVAGFGSRFFPVAKSVNKCMLPVLDKPVVHFAVQECVRAGIEQIAIVTAPGDRQIRHYFSPDKELEQTFHERGWDHKYEKIAHLHDLADFTFLEQPRDGRYGTAIPPMVAKEFIGADDFLWLSGDDLLLRDDDGSDLADLVRHRATAGVPAAIAAATVPGDNAHRYGVLITSERDARLLLDHLEEKPADFTEPIAYVNISRAVLPNEFVTYLDELRPAKANGEYQATDALQALAKDHDMLVHPVQGAYHDCGDPIGLLTANLAAARIAGLEVP